MNNKICLSDLDNILEPTLHFGLHIDQFYNLPIIEINHYVINELYIKIIEYL